MQRNPALIFVLLFSAVIVLTSSLFTVDEREFAIVSQLGEIREVINTPGLKVKTPFLQDVRFYDKRLLTIDPAEPLNFFAEKTPVLVDFYVKWRINDPKLYYMSLNRGDESVATDRLIQQVNAAMKDAFGKRNLHDVVSGERDKVMAEVLKRVDADVRDIGVQIVDVRIKRVELPPTVTGVYTRMEAERKRVANELRSQGAAESEKIQADAERQRDVILAEAYHQAQKIKGEGDAKAAAIYAQAFNQNPEFYAFYRSLEAYRASFKSKNDVLVVEPNSEFFKYLKSSGRSGK